MAVFTPPSYVAQSEVQITVTGPRDSTADVDVAEHAARRLAITYAVTATSSSVIELIDECGATAERPTIQAFAVQGTSVVRVLVRGSQADCAISYAHAIARTLSSTIETTENTDSQSVSADVIDSPAANLRDLRPSSLFQLLAGALLGAIVGLAVNYYRQARGDDSRTSAA